jgi:drug/metabolite transporter superfamily protein YnfA
MAKKKLCYQVLHIYPWIPTKTFGNKYAALRYIKELHNTYIEATVGWRVVVDNRRPSKIKYKNKFYSAELANE